MLNAAQMALFDVGSQNFQLMPRDTKDTPDGAAAAARDAIAHGASLILGPIFADHLKAVKPIAASHNVPVISFTTDWTQAGDQTYIMGFMPFTQVARVIGYAQSRGYNRFAVYAPETEYSDVVLRTLQMVVKRVGAQLVAVGRFSPQQRDLSSVVKDFVDSHCLSNCGVPDNKKDDKDKKDVQPATYTFDALLLPMGGENLRTVTNMLYYNGLTNDSVQFLGTGLWDDSSISNVTTAYGGWFAAPDPSLRRDFEKRYKDNFGETPARLSTLSYDATALAALLARTSP